MPCSTSMQPVRQDVRREVHSFRMPEKMLYSPKLSDSFSMSLHYMPIQSSHFLFLFFSALPAWRNVIGFANIKASAHWFAGHLAPGFLVTK